MCAQSEHIFPCSSLHVTLATRVRAGHCRAAPVLAAVWAPAALCRNTQVCGQALLCFPVFIRSHAAQMPWDVAPRAHGNVGLVLPAPGVCDRPPDELSPSSLQIGCAVHAPNQRCASRAPRPSVQPAVGAHVRFSWKVASLCGSSSRRWDPCVWGSPAAGHFYF